MISDLEKELGITLFARTTRAVTPTEAGANHLALIGPILGALEEANHSVRGSTQLRGVLRVGLSSSAGIREIIPRLPRFAATHPALRIELLMNDQRQDLVLEGVDVAIRLGDMKSSSATARKITTLQRVLAAAPVYLAKMGVPKTPADLASHRLIAGPVSMNSGWSFRKGADTATVKIPSTFAVSLNEGGIAAAIAGLGIVMTGMSIRLPEFVSGTLVQLLPDWPMERIDVHAVYANGPSAKPAARVLTEFLIAEFQATAPVQAPSI